MPALFCEKSSQVGWRVELSIKQAATRCSRSRHDTSQLPGAVSLPIAGPLTAWMPPSSLQGRVYGVSRER
ncbi:hypothetical protein C9397_17895 [Xanthomonas vasicola pv. vasculorum]|uniref:Uncharacterized protein n=1 Tax=Xanthomonas vasicola pv. vasculorum TaxID=325776 RepID=A0AAE8F8U1_XANVA|nr:hypothetical protein C7V42_12635 [Xanthomonas vasicola pv. vasculorum]AZR27438.1 hypothetical protein NX80_014290 [Xanthomonas vasicola pv. arecae]AZR30770.1 hypothetical protein KWO_009725 [Xanthomonas vasicola pv. musacearum NCPPB 4379]AZR35135.1 hypothetical protein NX08_012330 [Xanthomonas vasicola]RRJ39511.1 hypothetical protein EIM46_12280 [Xanthomonas vasicola pv. musacearum]